jgi:hypothetical protein
MPVILYRMVNRERQNLAHLTGNGERAFLLARKLPAVCNNALLPFCHREKLFSSRPLGDMPISRAKLSAVA